MTRPFTGNVKIADLEASAPIESLTGLDGYRSCQILIRLHGTPMGWVTLPVSNGRCAAHEILQGIVSKTFWPILLHLLRDTLDGSQPIASGLTDMLHTPHRPYAGPRPSVTVAVCTRDRTDDLALCLDALLAVAYEPLEILVVDNAPKGPGTAQLVETRYPRVRYVCEPRPGLDWARNRAILEARGEILAFTDDDVVVDKGWVTAFAAVFAEEPDVMAVTGLVVPYELETEAQVLFERYGGFGRGFERKRYRVDRQSGQRAARTHGGSGKFGTGANMAYRRSVFEHIGPFDPALDVGTVTNGGGDLEMFFRVLKEGHSLVYEPAAVVRHRHRRDYAQLRTQLTNNGIGFYSYLVRSALAYPDERRGFIRLGLWWLWWWNVRRLLRSFVRRNDFPGDLIWAELVGSFVGLSRYQKARRRAGEITRSFGPAAPLGATRDAVPS